MLKHRSRRHDELAVLISLLIALGLLVGAVITVWIWTVVSGRVSTVVSESMPEIP